MKAIFTFEYVLRLKLFYDGGPIIRLIATMKIIFGSIVMDDKNCRMDCHKGIPVTQGLCAKSPD